MFLSNVIGDETHVRMYNDDVALTQSKLEISEMRFLPLTSPCSLDDRYR